MDEETQVRTEGGEENESTPAEQRAPKGKRKKTDGPDICPKTGSYGSAEYKLESGNTRRDR